VTAQRSEYMALAFMNPPDKGELSPKSPSYSPEDAPCTKAVSYIKVYFQL